MDKDNDKKEEKDPRVTAPVPAASEPVKDKELEEDEPPENPFDFGGLPDRNLKKNLGCG